LRKSNCPKAKVGAYFYFKACVGRDSVKLHYIHIEEIQQVHDGKAFKAIFSESDPLRGLILSKYKSQTSAVLDTCCAQ
jgi:hypothetical protein